MSDNEQNSAADKSHEPTPQKIQKSREKGDVSYSPEATAAATYIGFFVALTFASAWSATTLLGTLKTFFMHPHDVGASLFAAGKNDATGELMLNVLGALMPVFLAIIAAAVCSVAGQRAFVIAVSKVKPKWSRLSIVDNAKQKFGPNGLAEFVRSAAKLLAVLGILYFSAKNLFLELPALTLAPAGAIAEILYEEAVLFCGLITAAAVLIAAIDLPWRRFQHLSKLKMTHQELKEENKETEGDPSLKSARRQRAEAIATNRMMADVPKSDIVIVNPTHYAVAIKWERKKHAAPICVAKGVDEVAARIREAAAASGVPIKRDPPTARSIHAIVDIGQEIRREHYAAVAAAIHYADKLRKSRRRAGVRQ